MVIGLVLHSPHQVMIGCNGYHGYPSHGIEYDLEMMDGGSSPYIFNNGASGEDAINCIVVGESRGDAFYLFIYLLLDVLLKDLI